MKPVSTVSGNDSGTYFFIAAVLLIELVQLTKCSIHIYPAGLCVLDGRLVNLFLEFLILLQDDSQFSKLLVHTNGYPSADAADAILKGTTT